MHIFPIITHDMRLIQISIHKTYQFLFLVHLLSPLNLVNIMLNNTIPLLMVN